MENLTLTKPVKLTSPFVLLIIAIPIAVAGQNIGGGLVLALLAWKSIQLDTSARSSLMQVFQPVFKFPILITVAFVLWQIIATVLNSDNPGANYIKYVGGHFSWIVLPVVSVFGVGRLQQIRWDLLEKAILWVAAFIGVVAISQYVIGWRVVGSSFVTAPIRARGFYSHPLTFAYVLILLWPIVMIRMLRLPRSALSWLAFLGIAVGLLASESRTVLLVATLLFGLNVLWQSRGRFRLILIVGSLLGVSSCLLFDNPLSRKVELTLNGTFDRNTSYPDDRVAFWHVHYQMVKERPFVGHGIQTTEEYLAPYYDQLGLSEFKKKYPAHNMFLQITTDSGLVGLLLFCCYFFWQISFAWKRRKINWYYLAFFQSWLGLGLAGLTQNAFHDSEVRYVMTLLVVFLWLRWLTDSRIPDSDNTSGTA